MKGEPNEPRALSAALAGPAFATRGAGIAMHVADRHVERWAPETSAGVSRQRPLRSLGFVDRLISPWVEAAQRSASLRMFSQYKSEGMAESAGREVSWVFPRPWYQDELDWMAASRRTAQDRANATPELLTTRGTYVAPAQLESMRASTTLPPALYEYVAPSLSVAEPAQASGVGYGGETMSPQMRQQQAYSPLVPLAAVQAAELMSRTVSRLPATVAAAPALRSVLASMLQRTTNEANNEPQPSRLSMQAPELVTPPAPREDVPDAPERARPTLANQVATQYASQHVQIAELQRVARASAERQAVVEEQRVEQQRVAEQQRVVEQQRPPARPVEPTRTPAPPSQAAVVDAARKAQQEAQQQIEERVQRRVQERTTQRLHEQARTEAATHARAAVLESIAPASVTPSPLPVQPAAPPPEVAAAIASLPPELASMLARRPDRAAQTIAELDQAYRTVELLARSQAAGAAFEVTRGPRLMMPVGLGGLVATIEQTPSIGPAPMPAPTMLAAMPREVSRTRAPALPWTAPRQSITSTSALGAAASSPPAALSHVAWSDRWLARFAGASPRSLETLSVATSEQRVLGLAQSAPDSVFVAPTDDRFDAVRDAPHVRYDAVGHAVVTRPGSTAPMPAPYIAPVAPTPDPVRVDDRLETPDEVFAAISAAATQKRGARAVVPVAAPVVEPTSTAVRSSIADMITSAAPSAPTAGLAAHLAASPFAPALRHMLAIPSATSFDVRALFGGALSASYLSGLIAPEQATEIATARALPTWATWGDAPITAPTERAIPEWDAAYVAPEEGPARDEADIAAMRTEMAAVAVQQSQQQAPTTIAPAAMTTVRSALLSWEGELSTMRAASEQSGTGSGMADGEIQARAIAPSMARELVAAMSLPMLGDDPQQLPRDGESWTSPGMMAERAQSWSVAQERSSADLSFDFVPPELVLAARVYGLGPAEAAQAARLAIAGPGQLAAMAGTVDRTFVQAMAYEAERRERTARAADPERRAAEAVAMQTAYPTSTGDLAVAGRAEPMTMLEPQPQPQPQRSQSAFGVERKTPRGAYLWPQATVAALKLDAPAPDGQQSMSIAALELLAAQTVAELGTYAALSETSWIGDARGEAAVAAGIADGTQVAQSQSAGAPAMMGATSMTRGAAAPSTSEPALEPTESDVLQAAIALVPMSRRARFDALYLALGRTSIGVSVSPAARAARALALAGRSGGDEQGAPTTAYERAASAWDVLPVVYAVELGEAAAAMAQAGGDSSARSSSASNGAFGGSGAFAGSPAERAMLVTTMREAGLGSRDFVAPSDSFTDIDVRPGMGSLSARAGEALGSYVAPSHGASSSSSSSESYAYASSAQTPSAPPREVGALLRAPTAAQEMVQTGRPAGRFGGGEVEIPTWFEAAARKMFESQSSSMGDGISMAELTLINAVPSAQIAASTRGTASHASALGPSLANTAQPGQKIDIEKIANEIYRQILSMMDAARARNGEPYL